MTELLTLRHCPDCGSEHLAAPCGMTFAQRLRSVRLDPSVTPSRALTDYYDDDQLQDLGWKPKKDRVEEYMEETGGLGAVTSPDDMTPEQAKHFFGDD